MIISARIFLLMYMVLSLGLPGLDEQESKQYIIDPETNKLQTADSQKAEKTVLVTIDDSPMPQSTSKMLDVLDRHDVRALFFLNGYLFDDREDMKDLIREIDRKGHLIGNHTWSHTSLTELDSTETRREIEKLQDKVKDIVGYRPYFFRPPFGEHNDYLWSIMHDLNMQSVNWSLMSFDWNYEDADGPDEIVELTLNQIHDGANMLFHDRKISAKALDAVLEDLIGRGYQVALPKQP